MADYNEKTVQELKEEAKSRGLHGYSDKNKDELVALLEESDQGDGSSESDSAADDMEPSHEGGRGAAQEEDQDFASREQADAEANEGLNDEEYGDDADELEEFVPSVVEDDRERERLAEDHAANEHHQSYSDPENPAVKENLSPEGQEALEEMGDDSVAAKEADLALDASGPLHLEKPSERLMAGAVNEKEAEEQEELIGELDEDHVGNIRGDGKAGSDLVEERKGSGPNGEIVQEDVVDFPPPLGEVEEERKDAADGKKATAVNAPYVQHEAAREAFPDESETVAKDRAFNQRAQLYTDGLSGQADNNTVLSYRVSDIRPASSNEESASESEDSESESNDSNEE